YSDDRGEELQVIENIKEEEVWSYVRVDEQNSHLCGLISVQEIQNRRPRKNENEANFREASYPYRVRTLDESKVMKEVQICRKAFSSLHGIGKKKLEVLQKGLKTIGIAPKDKRGKHSSKHRKVSEEKTNAVNEHIRSFKGRNGHYNLSESDKIYLPEDLSIKKMFLHSLVHIENRFNEIKVCFPIRGHSYMETDKNMGIIKQKTKVELPKQLTEVFLEARIKPRPFDVVEVNQTMFRQWTEHLNSYNGHFDSAVVTNLGMRRNQNLAENGFELPDLLYEASVVDIQQEEKQTEYATLRDSKAQVLLPR
ncbi:hypothetical protein J6590_103608, partial [Homalodisca vitripennis]